MTDVEDRLRRSLERRAEGAPRGQSMLDRVRQESARRTRRRRVVLAGGSAVVAVMAVLGVVTVAGRAAPSPVTSDAAIVFVAGASVAAEFPFSTPILLDYSTPVATLVAGRPTLVFSSVAAPHTVVTVTAGTGPPPAGAKPMKLGVAAAAMEWNGTLKTSGFTVWWTSPTGAWATIAAPSTYPLGLIGKFVSGSRSGPMPGSEPFTFATVPRGFAVDNIDATHVTFGPPGAAPGPESNGKILVRLDQGPLAGGGQPVTVAGRPGLLTAAAGTVLIRVDVGAGRILSVQAPATIHVARVDLLRFAAGIHPR